MISLNESRSGVTVSSNTVSFLKKAPTFPRRFLGELGRGTGSQLVAARSHDKWLCRYGIWYNDSEVICRVFLGPWKNQLAGRTKVRLTMTLSRPCFVSSRLALPRLALPRVASRRIASHRITTSPFAALLSRSFSLQRLQRKS